MTWLYSNGMGTVFSADLLRDESIYASSWRSMNSSCVQTGAGLLL
jgi:hypothetical protein